MSVTAASPQATAPVILFVYNRPSHTEQTIAALAHNRLADDTDLVIYSDGAKGCADRERVKTVRAIIASVSDSEHFRSVRIQEAPHNLGLAASVIAGVSQVIEARGKVIVLEDDHVTSADFLPFMNAALVRYESDHRVWSISGYAPPMKIPLDYDCPIYFTYRGSSWGYATWKDRWDQVDWSVKDYDSFRKSHRARVRFNRGGWDLAQMLDRQMEGAIDSWAVRWCYTQSQLDALTVYPVQSLVRNIGLDGTGTHSGFADQYMVSIGDAPSEGSLCDPFLDRRVLKSFTKMFGTMPQHLRGRASLLVRRVVNR